MDTLGQIIYSGGINGQMAFCLTLQEVCFPKYGLHASRSQISTFVSLNDRRLINHMAAMDMFNTTPHIEKGATIYSTDICTHSSSYTFCPLY